MVRVTMQKPTLVTQVRDDGSLEQGGGRRNGKKWIHSKYNLEIKLTGVDMGDEREEVSRSTFQVLA